MVSPFSMTGNSRNKQRISLQPFQGQKLEVQETIINAEVTMDIKSYKILKVSENVKCTTEDFIDCESPSH